MSGRVYCLYRVSTKGQVDHDDIPMQRQVCHEYAQQQGWEIVKEFYEKGVSGFKVSAKDRDVVQEIQRDAAQGSFDILLVFMFDRLGRKEDETPFIVEWFVRSGIEVWSAVEGQQRFDSHVDKLMNYIRYWQASGESLKTSVRVKTRLGQLVQEGRFRGGVAPYGYRLVKHGRLGKKNRELYDIEIAPQEAAAIREMFELSDRFGYGGRRISSELQSRGIVNLRSGEPFHYSSVQNILKNIMYVGILRSGDSRSEIYRSCKSSRRSSSTVSRLGKGRAARNMPSNVSKPHCRGRSPEGRCSPAISTAVTAAEKCLPPPRAKAITPPRRRNACRFTNATTAHSTGRSAMGRPPTAQKKLTA